MAVLIRTTKPKTLLKRVLERIDSERIRTWELDEDGDFTHSAEQWRNRAWMRARLGEPGIIFTIVPPQGNPISQSVYAVYHGRLIEMLLTHVDDLMDDVRATPFPRHGDRVK